MRSSSSANASVGSASTTNATRQFETAVMLPASGPDSRLIAEYAIRYQPNTIGSTLGAYQSASRLGWVGVLTVYPMPPANRARMRTAVAGARPVRIAVRPQIIALAAARWMRLQRSLR